MLETLQETDLKDWMRNYRSFAGLELEKLYGERQRRILCLLDPHFPRVLSEGIQNYQEKWISWRRIRLDFFAKFLFYDLLPEPWYRSTEIYPPETFMMDMEAIAGLFVMTASDRIFSHRGYALRGEKDLGYWRVSSRNCGYFEESYKGRSRVKKTDLIRILEEESNGQWT